MNVCLSPCHTQLLHPLGDSSPIEAFLKRNPNGGMHHICLEVDDIYKAVKDLKEKKIRVLNDEPKVIYWVELQSWWFASLCACYTK